MQATAEQEQMVTHVLNNENVCVNAVPGSGKTASIEFLAQATSKKICFFTYGRFLADETRTKMKPYKNVSVYTFHGFAMKHYCNVFGDVGIKKALTADIISKLPHADILILDEAQDMTLQLFHLSKRIVKDLSDPVMVVLGDRRQSIYGYKGADARYLELAQQIYERPFVNLNYSHSFRMTDSACNYVNNHLWPNDTYIHSDKDGSTQIFTGKLEHCMARVYDFIKEKVNLRTGDKPYQPEDVFILAPSLKKNSSWNPVASLENRLSGAGYPVHYEPDSKTNKVTKKKIVFSTYHGSKGAEKSIVIVMSHDKSYYMSARDADRTRCPEAVFVACTRAKEHLILIQSEEPLDHISRNDTDEDETNEIENMGFSWITEGMGKFMRQETEDELGFVRSNKTSTHKIIQEIESGTMGCLLTEHVGAYNGVAIVSRFCHIEYPSGSRQNPEYSDKYPVYWDKFVRAYNLDNTDISAWIRYEVMRRSNSLGVINPFSQLPNTYDWISDEVVEECDNNLKNIGLLDVHHDIRFETSDEFNDLVSQKINRRFNITREFNIGTILFSHDSKRLYLFVAKNDGLSTEEKCNMIVVHYLWNLSNKPKDALLYNTLTNEEYCVKGDSTELFMTIIKSRFIDKQLVTTNAEFIENALSYTPDTEPTDLMDDYYIDDDAKPVRLM